jgi:hypothetical protein
MYASCLIIIKNEEYEYINCKYYSCIMCSLFKRYSPHFYLCYCKERVDFTLLKLSVCEHVYVLIIHRDFVAIAFYI